MRGWVVVVVAMIGLPVAAQTPIEINSTLQTGWTSNATDSAAGSGDFYATHSHEMTLVSGTERFVLRGTLALSQTRSLATDFEYDDEVRGGVEAEFALGTNAALRLGYGVTQSWSGDDLAIAGLLLETRGSQTRHEVVLETSVVGDDQQATLGLYGSWNLEGETTLVGLGLPPLRLKPDVGLIEGRLAWEAAVSSNVAVLGNLHAWMPQMSVGDQLDFLRAPADAGRVSGGLRLQDGMIAAEAVGGVDMVWPKARPELAVLLPYFRVEASLTPMPELTVTAGTGTDLDLVDPLDGVASQTAAASLNATLRVAEGMELFAQTAATLEQGLYDTSLVGQTRSVSVGFRQAIAEAFGYGVAASLGRYDTPGESYDKAGIAVSLKTRL